MKTLLERMNRVEGPLVHRWNRQGERRPVQQFFTFISKLGNGGFWYFLMIVLPFLYGRAGFWVSLQMFLVGIVSLGIYKSLKNTTSRARPCDFYEGIVQHTAPLDQYSFPSGHTMHAFGFSLVAVVHFPELAWLLVPFTLLVAISRVILGLHYPSDVVIGASIGSAVASTSFAFI